jgi:hypothetical protein
VLKNPANAIRSPRIDWGSLEHLGTVEACPRSFDSFAPDVLAWVLRRSLTGLSIPPFETAYPPIIDGLEFAIHVQIAE